jgi:hypothetical protein
VIDGLRAGNQAGPVNLMATIGRPRSTHRGRVAQHHEGSGRQHDIEGMALSADAVANLIAESAKTGYFKNIEIKETFQDDHLSRKCRPSSSR